jgi:TRAP-type C4-dicarboxylate transport system substrate-binding protein
MNGIFRIKTIFCIILFLFTVCVTGSYAAEVINLRFATFMASDDPITILDREWGKEVEKRTDGRVKVTVYPGGTLMPVVQTYDSIKKGIADIGFGIFTYHRGRFPLMEVLDLPLGHSKAGITARMANEFYKKFKPKELDDVKVLWLAARGPDTINSKKPISKLEDLQGMKIRSSGLAAMVVKALGAAPVSMPITEAYDALSKGIADAIMVDTGAVEGFGLGDIVKYHIERFDAASASCFYIIMNKQKWQSLPKDIQTIIDKLNEEWIERAAKGWDDWEKVKTDALLKRGNKLTQLSKEENTRWAERIKPINDQWVQAAKAKGLPAEEALRFCVDYLKKHQ